MSCHLHMVPCNVMISTQPGMQAYGWCAAEEAYRDGVLEVGWTERGQERGTPQLPPGVVQVCIWVGLP